MLVMWAIVVGNLEGKEKTVILELSSLRSDSVSDFTK